MRHNRHSIDYFFAKNKKPIQVKLRQRDQINFAAQIKKSQESRAYHLGKNQPFQKLIKYLHVQTNTSFNGCFYLSPHSQRNLKNTVHYWNLKMHFYVLVHALDIFAGRWIFCPHKLQYCEKLGGTKRNLTKKDEISRRGSRNLWRSGRQSH